MSNEGDAEAPNDIAGTIWQKVKNMIPDMSNLYLQPLDPSSDMALSDRLSLICQSARPLGEFLDLSKLNMPPIEHVTTRMSHNMEMYLYNYFLLGCLHVALFSLVHFGAVFAVLCWVGLVWFLYVANAETIDVGGKFRIDSNAKLMIAVVSGVVAVVFGNVSTLIISVALFLSIVVGIHALLRDDCTEN